ncbi:MAG: LamB/YcsF family protein [Bacteroidetes bacterium]|nr:LamB/YcsF family protein [Bacteroidota bacterium]MBS1975004.1 LamB/YcsF family protein [Bacteroidota bacterium]
MLTVDVNCDMGESTPLRHYDINKDLLLLDYVSSINIACGGHAGDALTMQVLVAAAKEKNIAIGAHPSFPDKENFGRSNMQLSRQQIYETVKEQISMLADIAMLHGKQLHHVKPHGALYNMAAKEKEIARAICQAIIDVCPELVLYGLSGSELVREGKGSGLKTCSEAFADRAYLDDGSLAPRTEKGALITDPIKAAEQALQMVARGTVVSASGHELFIKAETICIHGDGEHALEFAKTIKCFLKANGIAINSSV